MATTNKFRKVRLFKVSKELNVSIDHIVEQLESAGHADALAGSGINAAITTEEAYEDLLAYFADDKEQADRVSKKRAARQVDHETEVAEAPTEAVEEPAGEAPATEDDDGTEDVPAEAPEAMVDEIPETTAPEVVETGDKPEAAAPVADETAAPEADDDDPVEASEEASAAAEESEAATEAEKEKAAQEKAEKGKTAIVEAEKEKAEAEAEKQETEETSESPEKPAVAEPSDEEKEEGDPETSAESATLSADRYKLAGTKVLGTIDLSSVEDDSGRRKRKRKRIATTEKTKPAAKSTPSKAKKDKGGRKGKKVDDAEVEQTLQETLRELEMGASRVRQRRRKQRRDTRASDRDRESGQKEAEDKILEVTEFVSTGELANLMDVSVNDVISTLFSAGMMVSINQRLDADTITIVADEFGFEVEFITDYTAADVVIEEDDEADLVPRDPVVTVMGHVDHGKTSLLDHIRKANVVAGEAGGITQHIGAYHVELSSGNSMTFLDTPGHEAFTAMRARGAQVTDVVILVVAADDAVMPQTIEAINHASAAGVPIIVAINKIDKPAANTDRVMQQLADHNVLVEQWGGKVQCELVSAKTGQGIEELLERVAIEAELLELKANPDRRAVCSVIESRLEKGRGNVATVLVQNGTLRIGDIFLAGAFAGRVRAMFDERERPVKERGPSFPALVVGLDGQPEVGDSFIVMKEEKEAREIAQRRQQIMREQSLRQRKHITLDEIGRRLALGEFRELNLIVKGDVGGSVEALSDSLMKLSKEEVVVNIIHKGVGAINESDVMLASASDAIIVGFQVRPVLGARQLAEKEEIDIRLYSVIYHAIEEVRDALEGLLSPEKSEKILGVAEVRDIFKVPKAGTVAGCFVVEGKIRRSDRIHLIREGVVIYDGALSSLRRFKDDVREVTSGYECGMAIDKFNDIKVGDQLEAYEVVERRRTLDE
ncbi:MAG: translation initiation factor IF-2 [Bacteroidetes bacterium CG12_big_fil_rev_8_21_14_0_65_60_17]|nr:MAG: translation initiation factor IF-2 [Bacteroidetes bacterium CG12_big_fil_rev_8_21_14_0_65_60_17]